MKKSLFYVFAGALCILGACNKGIEKPEENHESSGEKKMITEQVLVKSENDGNETKVAIDGSNTYQWTSNDYLAFFVTSDGGASYTKVTTASPINTETKEFTLSYPEGSTRGGYGVIPASFAKSFAKTYESEVLTVTYPDSYDISADITAGRYDNRGTYIPVPMVAINSGDNMTFYSIGALVKVTMSNIPVGTKTLYITFNQTVTGDFTVANPGTVAPTVSVADTENKTTVAITVSEDGLTAAQAANPIVLYIPVPTTTGLGIASSATTKATVSRNKGYAWAVNAITCTGDGSFDTNVGKYFVASGNLLAYNNSGDFEYSFSHPFFSTMGSLYEPHHNIDKSEGPIEPSFANISSGSYKDVYTFDELRKLVGDTRETITAEDLPTSFSTNSISISKKTALDGTNTDITEYNWSVPSESLIYALTFDASNNPLYFRNGQKGVVGLKTGVTLADVNVNVSGNDLYEKYAIVDGTTIPGLLLFPDGYLDQTDCLSEVNFSSMTVPTPGEGLGYRGNTSWSEVQTIGHDALEKMIDAGAVFIATLGLFDGPWEQVDSSGYYHGSDLKANSKYPGLGPAQGLGLSFTYKAATVGARYSIYYCSARLVREKPE